jgi:hypothetical protein
MYGFRIEEVHMLARMFSVIALLAMALVLVVVFVGRAAEVVFKSRQEKD